MQPSSAYGKSFRIECGKIHLTWLQSSSLSTGSLKATRTFDVMCSARTFRTISCETFDACANPETAARLNGGGLKSQLAQGTDMACLTTTYHSSIGRLVHEAISIEVLLSEGERGHKERDMGMGRLDSEESM